MSWSACECMRLLCSDLHSDIVRDMSFKFLDSEYEMERFSSNHPRPHRRSRHSAMPQLLLHYCTSKDDIIIEKMECSGWLRRISLFFCLQPFYHSGFFWVLCSEQGSPIVALRCFAHDLCFKARLLAASLHFVYCSGFMQSSLSLK